MTTSFEPRTFAYAFRPGHVGDPSVPTRDLNLLRPGHVVFSDPGYIDNDERTKQLLNEVLQHLAGDRNVRHEYSDTHHVTIEITDTEVIAHDFDGVDDRQHFTCFFGSIIYNGYDVDGPITPTDENSYFINYWA